MTETSFEPQDVAQLVRHLAAPAAGARVRLAPGRFLLPQPLLLSGGVELAGEPGRTVLDGRGEHPILVVHRADAVRVRGVAFEHGAGVWGGAISSGAATRLFVDQCRFAGNCAAEDGGAVFLRAAVESRIVRSIFEGNAARRGGGGLDVGYGADLLVDRCVFHANAAKVGGAVFLNGSGALELRNCTFLDNRAELDPGGAALFVRGAASSGPSAYVANSVFAGRDLVAGDPATRFDVYVAHSIVPPGLFAQRGFQGVKPNTLGAPDLVQLAPGAWGLAPGSPGVRTAEAARIDPGATDLLGRPLVRGGLADPGALASTG